MTRLTKAFERFVITGCNGFSGRHVARYLRAAYASSVTLAGVDRDPDPRVPELDQYLRCDLADSSSVRTTVRSLASRPSCWIHLAGVLRGRCPNELVQPNVIGTWNICQALVEVGGKHRLVNIGSSAEYGDHGREGVSEAHTPRPVGWYGLAKLMQTEVVRYYARSAGLDALTARAFNLVGRAQDSSLVVGRIVTQAVRCKLGRAPRIVVGNTTTYRDFIDVRDAVRAYHALALSGRAGEVYNVGSGRATQVEQVLKLVLEIGDIDVEIKRAVPEPTRADVAYQCADISKTTREADWQPSIPLRQTLQDMLKHELREARERRSAESAN